jgi:hypothetical protein
MSARRSVATTLGFAVAGVLISGCSFSIGGSSLTAAALERELEEQAVEAEDVELDSVECRTGLTGDVGDTTTCEVEVAGVRATWDVEVTDVDGSLISFEWEVDEGSQVILADSLADQIGAAFTEQTELTLTSVTCPEDEIPGTVGTEVECTGDTAEGRSGPIAITITSASGMKVDFNWRLVN